MLSPNPHHSMFVVNRVLIHILNHFLHTWWHHVCRPFSKTIMNLMVYEQIKFRSDSIHRFVFFFFLQEFLRTYLQHCDNFDRHWINSRNLSLNAQCNILHGFLSLSHTLNISLCSLYLFKRIYIY